MFSYPEASRCLGVRLELPNPTCFATGACIDTRHTEPGELFIALAGSTDNGHRYLDDAFRKGASGAIVDHVFFEEQKDRFTRNPKLYRNLLPVPDTLAAFQKLAAWYRSRFDIKTVGITGSVGKTSTKEFLSYLVKLKYPAVSTQGNFNNHLGLPLTLFRIQPADRFCIAELGANHGGEIAALSALLRPDAAILTPISEAHLEGFGSLEGIYDAKLEICQSLRPRSPVVFSSEDPELLRRLQAMDLDLRPVGRTGPAEFRITEIEARDGYVHFRLNDQYAFAFPGSARFLVLNAAMSVAMLAALGWNLADIPEIWEGLKLPAGRFELRELSSGIQVIFDGYNASPLSFRTALEAFSGFESKGRKVLVFGDMLELGPRERQLHEEIGRAIAEQGLDGVFAYGYRSKFAVEALHEASRAIPAEHHVSLESAAEAVSRFLRPGDTVLMKASRGMKIEEIFNRIKSHPGFPETAGSA